MVLTNRPLTLISRLALTFTLVACTESAGESGEKHFTWKIKLKTVGRHLAPPLDFPEELVMSVAPAVRVSHDLRLLKVKDDNADVPVFSMEDASSVRREKIPVSRDTAIYTGDLTKTTLVQLSKNKHDDVATDAVLRRGMIEVAGRTYTLHESRSIECRRNNSPGSANSPSEGDDGCEVNVKLGHFAGVRDFTFRREPSIAKSVTIQDLIAKSRQSRASSQSVSPGNIVSDKESLSQQGQNTSTVRSKKTPPPSILTAQHKQRRAWEDSCCFIDVVAIADFSVYQRFLKSESKNDVWKDIHEYYSFVFKGVALRYEDISGMDDTITVKLIRIVILKTERASHVSEKLRTKGVNGAGDELDASVAITELGVFAGPSGDGYRLVRPNDHVMFFTLMDLKYNDNGVKGDLLGLALRGFVCNAMLSRSIIEEQMSPKTIFVAAHELGHSLGANHDGEENRCNPRDGYTMFPGTVELTPSNSDNQWIFSNCSVDYFRANFNKLKKLYYGYKCLTQTFDPSNIPDVSDRLMGMGRSLNDQCKMTYGPMSSFCMVSLERVPLSEICGAEKMYCSIDSEYCMKQTVYSGTSCGDRKLCLRGKCVKDSRAPSMDEGCEFAEEAPNCQEAIEKYTCYDDDVSEQCCSSCAAKWRPDKDCQYGDHADWCSVDQCSSDSQYAATCCETCKSNQTAHSTAFAAARLSDVTVFVSVVFQLAGIFLSF